MTTMEPRQPEDGWWLRWFVQGSSLIARSLLLLVPGTLVFAVVAFALMTAPIMLLGAREYHGLPVYIGAIGSRAAAAIYVLWVVSVLMREDGHLPKVSIFTLKGAVASATFALGSAVFGAVMYGQVVALILSGTATPSDIPTRITNFGDVLSVAGGTMGNALADVIMFSGLGLYVWPVLLISVGAGWKECLGLAPRLLSRIPLVMVCCFFLSLSVSTAAMTLPLWTGVPLEIVWIGWIYVATREIFAGVTKNGAREKVGAGRLATAAGGA